MASGSIDAPIQSPRIADFATTSPFSIKNILSLPENHSSNSNDVAFESTRANMAYRPFTHHTSMVQRDERPVPGCDSSTVTSSPTASGVGVYTILSPAVTYQMKQYIWSGRSSGGHFSRTKGGMKTRQKRPHFSSLQIHVMEKEFTKCPYITTVERAELARQLRLTETQVKTWFQNRRTKWKRETKEKCGPAMFESRRFWEVKSNN